METSPRPILRAGLFGSGCGLSQQSRNRPGMNAIVRGHFGDRFLGCDGGSSLSQLFSTQSRFSADATTSGAGGFHPCLRALADQ